jgi:hypothetical protein
LRGLLAVELLLPPFAEYPIAQPTAHDSGNRLRNKSKHKGIGQIVEVLGLVHFVPLPYGREHALRNQKAERQRSSQDAEQSQHELLTIKLLLPPFTKYPVAEPTPCYQCDELNGERDHVRLA